jgi:hypothetical protein
MHRVGSEGPDGLDDGCTCIIAQRGAVEPSDLDYVAGDILRIGVANDKQDVLTSFVEHAG